MVRYISPNEKGRSGLAAIHDAMPTNAVRADSVQNASPFSGGTKSIVAIFCNSTRTRSEEHTSELQSLMRISYAVFCLKKQHRDMQHTYQHIITSYIYYKSI